MRKSNLFLLFLAFNILLVVAMFVNASLTQNKATGLIAEREGIVRNLELTDLCVFTEASYTRHLTQSDLHTPFQDSPMALEHFPSGSRVMPPARNGRGNGNGKVD